MATKAKDGFIPIGIDYNKSYSKIKCPQCGGDCFAAIQPGATPPISITCAALACRHELTSQASRESDNTPGQACQIKE